MGERELTSESRMCLILVYDRQCRSSVTLTVASLHSLDQIHSIEKVFDRSLFSCSLAGSPVPGGGVYPNPSALGTPSHGTYFLCSGFLLLFTLKS